MATEVKERTLVSQDDKKDELYFLPKSQTLTPKACLTC